MDGFGTAYSYVRPGNYQVYYRDGDTNVGLRLRAWRPKSEVLLPWELRQTIAKEVRQEAQLYDLGFDADSY